MPNMLPIKPLRPAGGTRSKRHRGLTSVVVLRQAPVDRIPEEDFASCARSERRSSTRRLTLSSPSPYKGKKRRRAQREHYWSKKQIIQPQNLLIDCFSFPPPQVRQEPDKQKTAVRSRDARFLLFVRMCKRCYSAGYVTARSFTGASLARTNSKEDKEISALCPRTKIETHPFRSGFQ